MVSKYFNSFNFQQKKVGDSYVSDVVFCMWLENVLINALQGKLRIGTFFPFEWYYVEISQTEFSLPSETFKRFSTEKSWKNHLLNKVEKCWKIWKLLVHMLSNSTSNIRLPEKVMKSSCDIFGLPVTCWNVLLSQQIIRFFELLGLRSSVLPLRFYSNNLMLFKLFSFKFRQLKITPHWWYILKGLSFR